MNPTEEILYPIRINKYMALLNLCTRRKADLFIEAGLVKVNGVVATLGQKIQAGDVVVLDRKTRVRNEKDRVYVLYHKPIEVVTEDIRLPIPATPQLFSVGRLDKDSEGLILFTNDGRVTDRLLHPDYDHEKEYLVTVDKRLAPSAVRFLGKGVLIEGYMTRPAEVAQKDEKSFSIILTEGKKHQIRRMCAALGYQVQSLKRTRIMNLELGDLLPGSYQKLEGEDLNIFLKSLGL